MSIVVKGARLPNNCGACPLRLAWCTKRLYMVTRPERCPLEPVEPERKRGKWIVLKHTKHAMCSECRRSFVDVYDLENWDHYCRHCGTVMESIVAEEEWDD